jgi:hypothetical protein
MAKRPSLRWSATSATAALLIGIAAVGGCATTIPKDALVLSPDSLQRRQLQSRRYDGISESQLLSACAGVLQDIGFNIDESETKLGVIVASKDRSAFSAGQITAAVALALFGVYSSVDKDQKIRVSLVTRSALASDGTSRPDSQVIRITIQRLVHNTNGQLTRVESIDEPKVYQQFFDRLSKSIFLEAQQI